MEKNAQKNPEIKKEIEDELKIKEKNNKKLTKRNALGDQLIENLTKAIGKFEYSHNIENRPLKEVAKETAALNTIHQHFAKIYKEMQILHDGIKKLLKTKEPAKHAELTKVTKLDAEVFFGDKLSSKNAFKKIAAKEAAMLDMLGSAHENAGSGAGEHEHVEPGHVETVDSGAGGQEGGDDGTGLGETADTIPELDPTVGDAVGDQIDADGLAVKDLNEGGEEAAKQSENLGGADEPIAETGVENVDDKQ
uniref:Uncharacterized protein n=1 Tax=Ditylenchus dipsaci TaxID=166011 RepID=A0A915E2E4_9BILA